MGDAAWPFDRLTVLSDAEGHLDRFEQPGRQRVFQHLGNALFLLTADR